MSLNTLILFLILRIIKCQGYVNDCYDENNNPRRCLPPFQNAAFNILVNVTNTCGSPPIEYCLQTDATGPSSSCLKCDSRDPKLSHSAAYLTDFNNNDNLTWWQSETMLEKMQYPNSVNLTLNLGKSFDITYIRLKFRSPRPESFAIYKRTRPDSSWEPYQYYSATCPLTYGIDVSATSQLDRDKVAICTSEASDISPLTGGNIAFSTLDGRPNALYFEFNAELQEWVTATDIRVTLNRLNTFGDELFEDPKVLKSYYYAISDFAVGGRCKCNGHARECVPSTGKGLPQRLVCRCEHNTAGPDCEKCAPFYNDLDWQRATATNSFECKSCECNGLSDKCYFDKELYQRTGRGGHCIACTGNTDGPHCERCRENHYPMYNETANPTGQSAAPNQTSSSSPSTRHMSQLQQEQHQRQINSQMMIVRYCEPCNCNPTGSLGMQCNSLGKCPCKTGVAGDKCDRCAPNYFGFSETGCRPCGCNAVGSVDRPPRCRSDTGQCVCKQNVEGQACDRCKPGYFDGGLFTSSMAILPSPSSFQQQLPPQASYMGDWSHLSWNPDSDSTRYYSNVYNGRGDGGSYQGRRYQSGSVMGDHYREAFIDSPAVRLPQPFGALPYSQLSSSAAFNGAEYNGGGRGAGTRKTIDSQYLDRYGCVKCYCYGHSSICTAGPRYESRQLSSDFSNGPQRWRSMISRYDSIEGGREIHYSYNAYDQNLGVILPRLMSPLPLDAETGENDLDRVQGGGDTDPNYPHKVAADRVNHQDLRIPSNQEFVYFSAPEKYLGDQRFSYNRYLTFRLRVPSVSGAPLRPSRDDVQLFGGTADDPGQPLLRIGLSIYAQGNSFPNDTFQTYAFRLHEDSEFGWSPPLDFYTFVKLLSNITAIRIRAIYTSPSDSMINSNVPPSHKDLPNQADRKPRGDNHQILARELTPSENEAKPVRRSDQQHYNILGEGYIDDFTLQSAKLGTLSGKPANWIEFCTCPKGYVGQFCESCAAGFKREISRGGPTSKCVPCQCNRHSDTCDAESGACICEHNTAGSQCQVCAPGYFGNAIFYATDDDDFLTANSNNRPRNTKDLNALELRRPDTACQRCPCPGGSECFQDDRTKQVICTNCPIGNTGNLCELCADGWFGNPPNVPCKPCECNNNTDPNSIGNCDRVTGRCLRCIYNTDGPHCETCLSGFFGIALSTGPPSLKARQCKACNCYGPGTITNGNGGPSRDHGGQITLLHALAISCEPVSGQCPCLNHVTGRQCDTCETGHWDVRSGAGCRSCGCDPRGSAAVNVSLLPLSSLTPQAQLSSCNPSSGVCSCLSGVTGRTCDSCSPNHYGFGSPEGCKDCNCDPFGSMSPQCSPDGRCPCKPGITGIKCDLCQENKYDLRAGCIDCPPCYGLVQTRVNEHRRQISNLKDVLKDIGERPPAMTDTDFETSLNAVDASLDQLANDARMATGGDFGISEKISELAERVANGFELETSIGEAARAINDTILILARDRMRDETSPALEDLTEALTRASAYYADEAQSAFEGALKAAQEFGSRSAVMSDLSRESRSKIDSLKNQVDVIGEFATEAYNITKKTEDLALNMLNGQNALNQDIVKLNKKYLETETLFNQTREQSRLALDTANQAYDKALIIYQEALETKLPEIDVKELLNQANELTEQTNNVFPVIEELLTSNQQLLNDAKDRSLLLEQILGRAEYSRNTSDRAIEQGLAVKEKAESALVSAETTLKEARDTLKTLQDFDNEIQSHKRGAAIALEQIPAIRALIEETEHKRVETEQKLLATQSEVEAAKEQAIEASDIMDTIKDQAQVIQNDVDVLLRKAATLNQRSTQLRQNLSRFEQNLSAYEQKVNAESSLATEAVLRAEEAQGKASLNLHTVTEALDVLSNIQDQLENVGVVDKEQLDILNRELDRASGEVDRADLDARFARLVQLNENHKNKVFSLKDKLGALSLQVDNVYEIHESLPEGCFKVLKLEP